MFYSNNLFFRRYTFDDILLIKTLYQDWNWENIDGDFAEKHLKNLIFFQYEQYDAGVWAVFSKENENYVGHCGTKYHDEEWHLSFRFLKSFWKNDAPVEAINACVSHDFKRLQINEIVVHLDKKSKGAAKMLLKSGMKHRFSIGEEQERYSIFRN